MLKAQAANALDGLYRWQWQAARLLERQGEAEQAIAAYRQSIATLETIRPELSRRSVRSFQASVAPVFFGMAELLLRQQSDTTDPAAATGQLRLVRTTIEKLKVAEIQNYFQNDCVIGDERTTELDEVGATKGRRAVPTSTSSASSRNIRCWVLPWILARSVVKSGSSRTPDSCTSQVGAYWRRSAISCLPPASRHNRPRASRNGR
jgi:hypothetical protein